MLIEKTSLILPTEYEDTVLSVYLKAEVNSYTEPSIKGTYRRDEQKEFSKVKHKAACLIGTTNIPLKELAEMMGISYSTLRQWNIEPRFQERTKEKCREFSIVLTKFIHRVRGESSFINEEKLLQMSREELRDAELYSECVLENFIEDNLTPFGTERDLKAFRNIPESLVRVARIIFKKDADRIIEKIIRAYLKRAIHFYRKEDYKNLNKVLKEDMPEGEILKVVFLYLDKFFR